MKKYAFALLLTFAFLRGASHAQVTAGTGTAGRIPIWTGAHSQGNSLILQSGSNIGIGTTAPTALLNVTTTTATTAIYGRSTSNAQGVLGVSNTGYGVRGGSNSSSGVRGYSTNGNGVTGTSINDIGVFGLHTATTGTEPAVQGSTSSTAGGAVGVLGTSPNGDGVAGTGDNGVYGQCNSASGNGVLGVANAGDSAYGVNGFSSSGFGVVGSSSSASGSGVDGFASGATAYGGHFVSNAYRGCYIDGNASHYALFVDAGGSAFGGYIDGDLVVTGTVTGAGSRSGYAVDHMQNADGVALEQGDVVVIADNSGAPVLGTMPAARIKLATSAHDTAVVGVVDRVTYVPDDRVRAAYLEQQKADHDASVQARNASLESGNKVVARTNIPNRISDQLGTVHTDPHATQAAPGRYCSVVTFGSYKAVKVDANYGAIKAGDLLTTSWHAGYAMKVQDKTAASGAVIGKALGGLATGTGTIPILVTLK